MKHLDALFHCCNKNYFYYMLLMWNALNMALHDSSVKKLAFLQPNVMATES